jgi:hypothetical protein
LILTLFFVFIQLKGNGPARLIQLQPRCIFAMDMAQLVSFHPEGLPISQVVPSYKTTFGRELVVANLGYSKLIKALESLPNILVVSINRRIHTCMYNVGTCILYTMYILVVHLRPFPIDSAITTLPMLHRK